MIDEYTAHDMADLFTAFLQELRDAKPNDRSPVDRYWAITITEVEKAYAIFKTYCMEAQQQEEEHE